MGKLKQDVTEAVEAVVEADEDTRQEYWARDNALGHALTLHKTNGGMKHVQQVLADAQVILDFLKGENHE
jgi:hypothetical protein